MPQLPFQWIILLLPLLYNPAAMSEEIRWDLDGTATAEPVEYAFCPAGPEETGRIMPRYVPQLDMRGMPWTLTGTFQTDSPGHADNQYLLGTRNGDSEYTGWALSFWQGKIRLLAAAHTAPGKQLLSRKRYDDGQEHRFQLAYTPERTELKIDGESVGVLEKVGDLGHDPRRRFAVGASWEKQRFTVSFLGRIRNLKMSYGTADATRLDEALKNQANLPPETAWIDVAAQHPEFIRGRGWNNRDFPYRRLPERFRETVRPPIWALSTHSTGIYLHFKTVNANRWGIRWTLTSNAFMPHMTPLGINGLDVYAKIDGKNWTWAASARPHRTNQVNTVNPFIHLPSGKTMEFLVYLPLYTGVEKIELTLPPGGRLEPAAPAFRPVVFYGTSMTQGCSASRPGMVYTAILGRRLHIPIVNLGFSGNGTMDPEFVEILAEIDAAAYVFDGQGNMIKFSEDEVKKRLTDSITRLRQLKPEIPIIVIESPLRNNPKYDGSPRIGDHRRITRPTVQELQKTIPRLFLVNGDALLGTDTEATIDGAHPTDLGFFRFADALEPVLRDILKRNAGHPQQNQ